MIADARFEGVVRRVKNELLAYLNHKTSRAAIPEAGRLIWEWFHDLGAARSWHTNGPNPISYVDILSYSQVMRWPIRPHEVTAIRELDQAYLNHYYERRDAETSGKKTLPAVSKSKMTTELYDAMFG